MPAVSLSNQQYRVNHPIDVKYMIMMGDSLSDRGTVNKRLLFGCLPMRYLSGLEGRSPDGRFTNGLVWSDHVTAKVGTDFTIKRLEKKWGLDHTDISDAIIVNDKRLTNAIFKDYALDDDLFVNYHNNVWIRSYCQGGLMSHNYKWYPSTNIKRYFSRLILASLDEMRENILAYDKERNVSYKRKAETLVIEWSGANDLVTVNAKPSIKEVNRAINARVNNVKKLIATGYKHFILFNLPNLALTPRFQAKNETEREDARLCSEYFNAKLIKTCLQLSRDYPYCTIFPGDLNSMFETIYKNPQPFFFDEDKKKLSYLDSVDFDNPEDGVSASTGYMFYDDVHPTADVHALLANYFYEHLKDNYELLEPDSQITKKMQEPTEQVLLECFRKHYKQRLDLDRNSIFYRFNKPTFDYQHASLEEVLKHALDKRGTRTREVLVSLGWLSESKQIVLDCRVLKNAMEHIKHATNSINNAQNEAGLALQP